MYSQDANEGAEARAELISANKKVKADQRAKADEKATNATSPSTC